MKILLAQEFFTDYELYETSDPELLKHKIALALMGHDVDIKPAVILGTQDDMTTEEAEQQADEIIFLSDIAEKIEQYR